MKYLKYFENVKVFTEEQLKRSMMLVVLFTYDDVFGGGDDELFEAMEGEVNDYISKYNKIDYTFNDIKNGMDHMRNNVVELIGDNIIMDDLDEIISDHLLSIEMNITNTDINTIKKYNI